MVKNDSITMAQESIKVLSAMLHTLQWEPVRQELEFAINEMKKCIPVKPIRESWCPNRCPNCRADLGGECTGIIKTHTMSFARNAGRF